MQSMVRPMLIAAALLAGAAAVHADEPGQVFEQANASYLQGKYAEVIASYERILANGLESGELYFNLGNAHYKSGNLQRAILNYERALRFIPGDEDLLFNLQLANLQVVDKIDVVPRLFIYRWIDRLFSMFALGTVGWSMYVFFVLTLAAFSLYLVAPGLNQKRAGFFSGVILGVLLVVTSIVFVVQSYREANTRYAVVMADVANIKSAPDARGNDAFVLHRGVKVQVLDAVNRWRKIRLADGKVGWIPEDECEVI